MPEYSVYHPYLDAHALEIIERVYQARQISSMAHCSTHNVLFKQRPIDVIVGRISVDKTIEK